MFAPTGAAIQRPPAAVVTVSAPASAAVPEARVVTSAVPAAAPVPVEARAAEARALAAMSLPERKMSPNRPGMVPMASWWSDLEVQTPNGEWCRKPPPYAASKPPLPQITPGTDKPELTTELAKKHASADNMLIATYVNYNRLDFAYTFVKHLVAIGNPHFLVGALDEKALRGLQSNGIQSFLIDSGLTTNDYGWGTYAFRQLGLHKVQLVYNLAKTGVNCITVDADAFVLRDPFPYIRARPRADVLMSSDHLVATNGYSDTGLEGISGFYSAYNIGYIYIKANAIDFVEAWRDTCFRRKNDWDQVLFGQVLAKGADGRTVDSDRLRAMFERKDGTHVMAGVLPVSLFASGHTHFVSRMSHLMHEHPYMVHTTFQYGGAQGKRHRLREAMMWEDEPDYFAQNYLVYEPDLPYNLVYPKGGKVGEDGTQKFDLHGSVEQHFQLVHHQLTQIRNALALAKALDRILILPRLVCGLDRWWAPHSGIIPGSAARLPLLECPADHVIDLERIGKPEKVVREASFLCNPRTPAAVLRSQSNVSIAPVSSFKVAADGSNGAEARTQGLPVVQRLRSEFSSARVLRLTTLPPDYRAILPESEISSFEVTMRGYAGLWCCNRPPGGRGAGHIWYDFLHDVLPHKDRFNRRWDAATPWYPKMGP
eukprot:CAMPEP_0115844046 /NCGR_PEP_ID=MMETSP0287-20121206/8629_1 /TAXON_ID=412157 /ORGANISM="Chrysochromulina rotalis, Strain UIO044" /LENGTH=653 /DNA_ID=CAMNT_0003297765 /DNA_START=130 /DNA_END=2091 /DNA_ORIENTATION=+